MLAATFLLALAIADTPRSSEPVSPARAHRIREVRFVGHPTFAPNVLKKVLEDLAVRRRIPGIWTSRPRYDARAIDADMTRLRSFYVSRGYFAARVAVADVAFDGRDATITLSVESGPQFRVHEVKIEGLEKPTTVAVDSNGNVPVDPLCKCLLDAKRVAETQGRIDFAVDVRVSNADRAAPLASESRWADVIARVKTGSPYLVHRISFSGNYRVNGGTLRRAMVLQERALFDLGKLRNSLARLDQSGLLEPITAGDIHIQRNPADLTASLTIAVRERRRRYWSVSGPVVAATFTGALQASISSRLPPWGRGVFEASTYYATVSLIGLPSPLTRLFSLPPKQRPSPLFVLERPYLPGQSMFSGFALSPKRPGGTLVTSYGVTHLSRGIHAALGSDTLVPPSLVAPVQTSHLRIDGDQFATPVLICEPPRPRLQWLRRGAAYAANLALGAFRPF